MAKSVKFTNDTYLNSEGVIHENGGTRNTKQPLKKLLPTGSNASNLYSTQYLQLGYFECSLVEYDGWSTVTLLVSSTFYGIQHWSTHMVTISQAGPVGAHQIRTAGNTREFYYKIDSTNKRVYLYARCTGGNGFGHWVVAPLTVWNCNWVTEVVQNVAYASSWVQIGTYLPTNPATTPTILYDGGATQADITLSQSAANFKRLKIYYCQTAYLGTSYNSVEIPDPNGKTINLSELILLETLNGSNYNGVYGLNRSYTISGTSIKLQHQRNNKFVGLNGTGTWGVADAINIVKVVGYTYY